MKANQKKTITVLLADDHPVVRSGLRNCLSKSRHLKLVGEASDGREALDLAIKLTPDILLMDISMPKMDGLVVAEKLRKEAPGVKVIILSMHSSREYVSRIVQARARGYLLKNAPSEFRKRIGTSFVASLRGASSTHISGENPTLPLQHPGDE